MANTNAANGTSVAWQAARWLSVIGALNWGLVGIFDWDLVRAIFGHSAQTDSSPISRAIYALVGVAGVALAVLGPRTQRAIASGHMASSEARA